MQKIRFTVETNTGEELQITSHTVKGYFVFGCSGPGQFVLSRNEISSILESISDRVEYEV